MKTKSKLFLVGAGCAGIEGLTLRAAKVISQADVIVYDSLIDPAILSLAPDAIAIEKGKRGHQSSAKQQEIHELLLDLTKKHHRIVRLQGGDPMIFGRGMEELEALRKAIPDLDIEIVPGISSFYGIPAKEQFGLTKRNLASGFMVLTAAGEGGKRSQEEWKTIADFKGTVVFLMGMRSLSSLSAHLIQAGKDPNTPCVLLSSRSSSRSEGVKTDLAHLEDCAKRDHLYSPGLVIVGGTAAFYRKAEKVQIGLCGSKTLSERLKERLPLSIQYEQVLQASYTDHEIPEHLFEEGLPDWIVLTSGHGVQALMNALQMHQIDLRSLSRTRFALIGKQSAAVLAQYGLFADLVCEDPSSAHLLRKLLDVLKPDDVIWLAQSDQAIDVLFEGLKAYPNLKQIPLYDLQFVPASSHYLPEFALQENDPNDLLHLDYLIAASRQAARAILKQGVLDRTGTVVVISEGVGDVLRKECEKRNIRLLTASSSDADGLAQTILTDLPKKQTASPDQPETI